MNKKVILIGGILTATVGALAYIPISGFILNPKDQTDNFYTVDYSNTTNDLSNKKTNVSDSNDIVSVWLEHLSKNNGQSKGVANDYTKKVYYTDNTAGLLGYYFRYYSKNQKGGVSNYQNDVNQIQLNLSNSRVDYNHSLSVDNYLKALYTLYASGQSYGYIYAPDPSMQAQNQRNPALWSFRVGQQAMRDAVVKEYAERLILLNKELERMYNDYKRYCDLNNINDFQTDYATVSVAPDYIVGMCSGTLFYMNVINQLNDVMRGLQDMDRRKMQIECANLLTNINTLKAQITQAEIQLATLSATYGLLSNVEKDKLR